MATAHVSLLTLFCLGSQILLSRNTTTSNLTRLHEILFPTCSNMQEQYSMYYSPSECWLTTPLRVQLHDFQEPQTLKILDLEKYGKVGSLSDTFFRIGMIPRVAMSSEDV